MQTRMTMRQSISLADKACFPYFRDLRCIICGTTYGVVGHHAIRRANYRHRHSPQNIIPVCPYHHGMAEAFVGDESISQLDQLIRDGRPLHYRWIEDHRHDVCTFTQDDYLRIAEFWKQLRREEYPYSQLMEDCGLEAA